jgi:cell division septation protein DedD
MAKKHIKTMNENLMMDDTKTRPKETPVTPGTQPPKERPDREFLPKQNPNKKERNKPQATADEVADMFLMELEKIKNTPRGEEIIKNLYNKYAR